MSKVIIVVAGVCALWFACSKETPPETTREVFTGVLEVDRGLDSVGGEYTDTISFILDDVYYSMLFVTRHSNLCDSDGKVTHFGQPSVKFEPTRTYGTGCDSLRVVHGTFDAVFYGDTAAVLVRTDYEQSIKYVLRLKK